MLDTLAFMDQKDSGSVIYYAGFAGDNAPRAVFLSFLSSGPVARHHAARFSQTWCLWFTLQKTLESPQLQSFQAVDISFAAQRCSTR